MGAFHQRVFGMTTTAFLVEFFFTEWIEINEYLYIKKNKRKRYTLLVSTVWTMRLCQRCLCISLCLQKERWEPHFYLYLFGHFHCAWCITWYAIEMQYLHIKTKAQLLTGAFVCKHQVVVWNSVLSEHFEAISAENVGQLISYHYTSGKLERIYSEKQQNDSAEDNGSKHMEGVLQGKGMLDKIGIVHWMNLPNTHMLWTISVTNCRILSQDICFRGSQYYKCSVLVSGWRHTYRVRVPYFDIGITH